METTISQIVRNLLFQDIVYRLVPISGIIISLNERFNCLLNDAGEIVSKAEKENGLRWNNEEIVQISFENEQVFRRTEEHGKS